MKILFVCTGNSCRSPMAELYFNHLAREAAPGLQAFSAGIYAYDGNPISASAKAVMKELGINASGFASTAFTPKRAEEYDLLVGMDSANIRGMHRILGAEHADKIVKLMELTPRGGDVADPWYSDRFDVAYRDIFEGCAALLVRLEKE